MPHLSKGPGRQPECLPHAEIPGPPEPPDPDSGPCCAGALGRPSRQRSRREDKSHGMLPIGLSDQATKRCGLAPRPHEPGASKEEKKTSATNRCSRLAWVRLHAAGSAGKSQALGKGAGRRAPYQALSSLMHPSMLHSGPARQLCNRLRDFPCLGCAGSDVRIHGLLRHFIIKEMGSPWGLRPGTFPQELLCHLVPEAH